MTSPERRDLLRRMLGIGLLGVVWGCGPTDTVKPPDERRKEAASTKTPPPPDMKPQESFDPRKALHEKTQAKEAVN